LVDWVDANPLVIKLRLTNIIQRRMELHIWIPQVLGTRPYVVQSDFGNTTIQLFKGNGKIPAARPGLDHQLILKPSESCILEIQTGLDTHVDHAKDGVLDRKLEIKPFLAIPVWLKSFGQFDTKIILLCFARDKMRSLKITSDVLPDIGNDSLLKIVRIRRSQLNVPAPVR